MSDRKEYRDTYREGREGNRETLAELRRRQREDKNVKRNWEK